MHRWLSLCCLLFVLVGCMPWERTPAPTATAPAPTATAQPQASAPTLTLPPPPEPTATPEPTAIITPTATIEPTEPLTPGARLALFNDVWQTIDEHYLYADFNGADWAAIYDEFEPRATAAASDDELYALLEEMVGRLNDSHSRFAAPVQATSEDALASGTDTYVGIGVLTIQEPDAALVTLVFPDSPAQEAGITRGDRIVGVNGEPFTSTEGIRGPEGSQITVTVQAPQAEPRELTMTRRAVLGKISPSIQVLPNAPDIGYLLIPSLWADDMHTQVTSALLDLQASQPDLRGLVIDLRGNGGGWRTVLTGILGQFVSGTVGEFFSQDAAYPLEIEAGPAYDFYHRLPLVVLINHESASYAEVLAAALQDAGADVVGTPSQGNTETIYQYNFDDGSRLWVAQEGFRLPDLTDFEGSGVQPDQVIAEDWAAYSLPYDPAVLTAIALIDQRSR